MVESCPKDSPGQQAQTLLEAAKAFSNEVGLSDWTSLPAVNLRAAIAREEAKVHVPLRGLAMETAARIDAEMIGMLSASDAKATLVTALDRAQQAESTAAWHKAESERLSADLAKTKESAALNYSERAGQWQQRAEKAERALRGAGWTDEGGAEWKPPVGANPSPLLASLDAGRDQITSLRQELTDVHRALAACLRPETQTGSARGDANVISMVLREAAFHLIRAGCSAPSPVREALPKVVDELLRLRAEAESAKGRMASAIAADLDTARDHLQAVVGAAKVACTAMTKVYNDLGSSQQPEFDAAQEALSRTATNARRMVLDRVGTETTVLTLPKESLNGPFQTDHSLGGTRRCGKTTATIRLAKSLAEKGHGVVVVFPSNRAAAAYAEAAKPAVTAGPGEERRQGFDVVLFDHSWYETAIASERQKHADSAPGEAAGFPPHPVVRDPATGAMGVKTGIVRDPVTGWTFDTMRQQFDAARTTVRVLAAELVAARQQIAGTKGFEA